MKVFISHSSSDKRFVRTLKESLALNSIETWFDEDELDLGDSLITKLQEALDNSSHLVIILSPASVESEWVNFELKRAILNNRTGLTNKIIPIKYRDCKIPETLTDLIYGDLSNETVLPHGTDKVKFISEGFDKVFLKLMKALKNSSKVINKDEKKEIIKSIVASEEEVNEYARTIHRGNYSLKGYSTKESREKYQKIISKIPIAGNDANNLRPFLLPPGVKHLFNPSLGEKIDFEDESFLDSYGHFAGFRSDDLSITVDRRTRDELFITVNAYYQVEIDPAKKLIKFVSKIENKTKK